MKGFLPGDRVCISGPGTSYGQDELVIRVSAPRTPVATVYVGERIYGLMLAVTKTSDLDPQLIRAVEDQGHYMSDTTQDDVMNAIKDDAVVYAVRVITTESIDHTGQRKEPDIQVWRGIVLAVNAPRFAKVSLWL